VTCDLIREYGVVEHGEGCPSQENFSSITRGNGAFCCVFHANLRFHVEANRGGRRPRNRSGWGLVLTTGGTHCLVIIV